MDADDRDLLIRLCTKAGTLMEDASVVAITSAGLDDEQLKPAVDLLSQYAILIKDLLGTAGLILLAPS